MKKLLLAFLLFSTLRLSAATIIATASGSWTDPITWGGQVPSAGDVAIIPTGITVTYPSSGNAYFNNPASIKIYGTYNPQLQTDDLRYLNPVSIEVFSGGLFYDQTAFVEFYIQNGSSIKVYAGGNWNADYYYPNILNGAGNVNSSSAWPTASTENPGPFTLSLDNNVFTFIADAPLPVALIGFTGKLQSHIASLQWQTGIEVNFNHFELEKATDGKTFTSVTSIAAKGDNGDYQANIPQAEPVAYYRLKIINNNNVISYSPVITLSQKGSNNLSVYPNPAKDYIHINTGKAGNAGIYSISGILVKKVTLEAGINKIDISSLASGSYLVVTENDKATFIKR